MTSKTAALAVAVSGLLIPTLAHAQVVPARASAPGGTARSRASSTPASSAPRQDRNVLPANATLPEPVPPDQIAPPTIALPNDPIEPYLLTKENGPFMVMAKTFRGPEAERLALALVLELRNEFGLPAYILRTKDFPRNSLVRNLPPTADVSVNQPRLQGPEKVRTHDEAAVLVGNCKTLRESEVLWHQVKKLKPKCIEGVTSIFPWRQGLCKALRTTNPFIPAQNLFPGKPDRLISQMNQGPHSIIHCPGRYSLQIAQFSGRSTFVVDGGAQTFGDESLKRSPLATAADDAEQLAEALAKAKEVRELGQPIYVYHDRTSSRVLIGSFQSPDDPKAGQLHATLLRLAVPLMDTDKRKRGIDKMIVPATALTDLETFKVNFN